MFFIPLFYDILCPMNTEIETLKSFTKAFALGFAITAPLGASGLLCIQRTMISGFRSGFFTALGAASAGGLYILAAAAGIYAVINFTALNPAWFKLAGGATLIVLGVLAASKKSVTAVDLSLPKTSEYTKDYVSAFFLALAGPLTLISFVAVFTGLTPAKTNALPYIAGVFSGSLFWWLFLALNLKFLQDKLAGFHIFLVNMLSGFTILAFGIIFIIQSLFLLI